MFWKSSLYMSTSSLFLIPLIHTEFLVIFWFFRPRWKPLVDAREGDLRRLLSEVFERKADYVILTTSSEKNFSLIALRKEKSINEILWKSRFSVETITFLRFFRAAYLRRWPRTTFADQGPSKTVAFFRIPSKIFILFFVIIVIVWQINKIPKNVAIWLRANLCWRCAFQNIIMKWQDLICRGLEHTV